MKKVKALVLLSGGLDSMLAVKVLQEQGIEVTGITFESNFYNAEKSKKVVEQLNIPLKIVDISKEMLDLVKNPSSGHGKHMNPCIDCHSLMIKKASDFLKKETKSLSTETGERDSVSEYDIIATGEVVGQRPFSQTKQALERVRNYSGVDVLRPLSAKLLPETEYEKAGLVDRNKLLDIEGRRREKQVELVRKYNIKEYPSSGGGCILTESEFSDKFREMINNWSDCDIDDVELLKHGRNYWVNIRRERKDTKSTKALIIVGRNKEDNKTLENLAKKGDLLVELKDEVGPVSLIRDKKQEINIKEISNFKFQIPDNVNIKDFKLDENKNDEELVKIAGLLTGYHAPKARGREVNFKLRIIN